MTATSQYRRDQIIQIVQATNGYYGVVTVVRADEQRLILVVADHADPHVARELGQVVLELAAELRVGNVVDEAREAPAVPDGQPSTHGAQMRVVIGTVVQISDTVALGDDAEESTHRDLL